MDIEAQYSKLILIKNLSNVTNNKAIEYIGQLIDISYDLGKQDGIKKAMKFILELLKRDLSCEHESILYYFMANAWSDLKKLTRDRKTLWEWNQDIIEKEIIYLRKAIDNEGFDKLEKFRKCQIFTNLGNIFSEIGRFIEAIAYWDKVFDIDLLFPMSIGNKGITLFHYALSLYDDGHKKYFLKYAYKLFKKALDLNNLHPGAKILFQKKLEWIENVLPLLFLNKEFKFKEYSLGSKKEEKRYREWSLKNDLFLNPLNDLGGFSIAAQDIFNLPNITTRAQESPHFLGFFNQMKQEYVSARYLYYQGINFNKPHFSDKDVYLYNTLDYPIYSLGIEKVKTSFRVAYSLFDKIGYFVSEYFNVKVKRNIYFKTLWYKDEKREKGLKEQFTSKDNWPLRGLFWLSKDLSSFPDYIDSIDPDARKIAEIRNCLEHKYLKIHNDLWKVDSSKKESGFTFEDSLSFSMNRKDFVYKTLKLIKLVRAALIYLSLAVHIEEIKRSQGRIIERVAPIQLDKYDDKWKI